MGFLGAIVEWTNDNNGFLMAVLTAVYVLATILILLQSWNTNNLQREALAQARSLDQARSRPYVVFSIEFVSRTHSLYNSMIHAYAVVRNLGATSAHDVLIETTPVLQGRLGIDPKTRVPAIVGVPISLLAPHAELRDVLAPSEFLFKDNTDEQLVFAITLTYSDINGTRYGERYSINLAAQKGKLEYEDTQGKLGFRFLEEAQKAVKALDGIARSVGSPDRSLFFTPVVPSQLSSAQKTLLRELVEREASTKQGLFFLQKTVVGTSIRGIGSEGDEIDAVEADVEYLCRAGVLHGHYSGGTLFFTVTSTGREFSELASAAE